MPGRAGGGSWGAAAATVAILVAACTVPPGTAPTPPSVAPLEWKPLLTQLGLRKPAKTVWRVRYRTGFEDLRDFAGFYSTPQSPMTRHALIAGGERHGGAGAHHAWLTGATGTEPVDGPNHRGYPTVQLQRRDTGTCGSPCLVELWSRVDGFAGLRPGEWLSLATFTPDGSDRWLPVVTVNVGYEGWMHLFHVPTLGRGDRAFQRVDLPFPRGRWVRMTTLLDVGPGGGAVAVWQDGTLVSAARLDGGDGDVDQMHFGLYAAPSLSSGSVWNDDLVVLDGG